MIQNIKQYFTLRNFIFFFSLIAGWPCVFYLMGWLPNYQINYVVLLVVSALFIITNKGDDIPFEVRKIIIIQIVTWAVYSLLHWDTSYFTRIMLLVVTMFLLKIQFNDSKRLNFIRIYDGWLMLQAVCGGIGMMLVLAGLLRPISTFLEMDHRMGYYFGLFTTNTYFGGLVRNAGFFDEPGALAFWGVFGLLFNKLYIKNKYIEYLLIIGLISTLSVAYFIQLALYLLLFYKEKSWKLVFVATAIFFSMKFVASYSDSMNHALFGRFEFNEETGSIKGDNRSDLLATCWHIFCNNPIIGVGARVLASPEIARAYGFVGANFFTNWAADGLIGGIITYLPLISLYRLGSSKKVFKGVALILLVGYLQRPYDSTQLLFPLTMFTMLLAAYLSIYKSSFYLKDND